MPNDYSGEKGFWPFKKTKVLEWKTLDLWGYVWEVPMGSRPVPPIAKFDTLNGAKKFIKEQVEPIFVVHEP